MIFDQSYNNTLTNNHMAEIFSGDTVEIINTINIIVNEAK